MRLAWTQERFSYEGEYHTFSDVCVIPKTCQKPHPPLWAAATTKETFPLLGKQGLNILVGLRGMNVPELGDAIAEYRSAWSDSGHPGTGEVILRMPLYLADTMEKALSEPEQSALYAYARLRVAFTGSIGKEGTTPSEERAERAERLGGITCEDLLRD